MCVCVCVCVFIFLSSNSGVGIPSGELNYSNFEYLNISGKELNVNDITEQILLQEKPKFSHFMIINLFPSC